jgi:hypothetical protein
MMSWADRHKASEELAVKAHELTAAGQLEQASQLFGDAATQELAALEELDPSKERTLGITAVSAAALMFKSGDLAEAARVAHYAMTKPLPLFARLELRAILQSVWNEEAQIQAGRTFSGRQINISVRGNEVLAGGAPLDLVLSKVQAVQSMILRVAEMLSDIPLRRRGPPTSFILDSFKPWLFQAPPGSYQFSIAIERPVQMDFFGTAPVTVDQVAATFLHVVREAAENPQGGLATSVNREEYRPTLLRLARNLAPTGRAISEIVLSEVGVPPVTLSATSRENLGATLRATAADGELPSERSLRGVLRALDLNKDWLEVLVEGSTSVRVYRVSETVDDLIGPMVNHPVTVRAKRGKGGRLDFVDIEQEE